MAIEEMRFPIDGSALWAGMGDFVLISPDGAHRIEIVYEGEPPHGDSYHKIAIGGHAFPGFAWGCLFAFSPCSRYAALSWMEYRYDRRTVVIDLERRCYVALPMYLYNFKLVWPTIAGVAAGGDEERVEREQYIFKGTEDWLPY